MTPGCFLALSDKYQIEYLDNYPFRYLIQLFSGGKKDHCAFLLDIVTEYKFAGILRASQDMWFSSLDKQTRVACYDLKASLSDREIDRAIDYLQELLLNGTKYSIIELVFSHLPLLKKIKFKQDRYMHCTKLYLRVLQVIGRLPAEVNCAIYNVEQVPDLLNKYGLVEGKKIIR